jgi:ABC-type dipeptide/oligopeptide/nickel transport system permease subunit
MDSIAPIGNAASPVPSGALLDPKLARNPLRGFISTVLRSRSGTIGMAIVSIVILVAVFGPLLSPYDPDKIAPIQKLLGPSSRHLLGTDELGRDMLSRITTGARLTFGLGVGAVTAGLIAGGALGVVAGYVGGRAELFGFRLIDLMLALPQFLWAVTIVSILGPSLVNAVLAVAIYMLPQFARLARGLTAEMRYSPFVEALVCTGCTDKRIIVRHIVPNILPALLVYASLQSGSAILTIAGLSFLGLGAQPPTAEWGAMIATGRNYIFIAPQDILIPGAAILFTVFGLNLLGDGLRDALDPTVRGSA